MELARLTLIYSLITIFAIAVNILCQALMIMLYKDIYAIQISVLVGTVVGLPIKYLLEKRYVFQFKSENWNHDRQTLIMYTFMGIFTTAVFISVEFTFHMVFNTDLMRFIGGAIGLIIGNVIKYHLDKRYVFIMELK